MKQKTYSTDWVPLGKMTWQDMEEYAEAYLEGRIPEKIIKESTIMYGRPRGFHIDEIPLPKHLQFRAAMAQAAPRLPWWKRVFMRKPIRPRL